jgi:serine/threonine protein kinase/Leucine-rich repeat (LRR) protein
MDEKLGCPPASELVELLQGKMVEPDLSRFSLHLEECSACQEKASTLSPYDTLIESLRGEAPVEDKIAVDVPRPLVEILKQIPRRDSGIGPDILGIVYNTVGSPIEQGLDFLSPAQEADEIGRLGYYRVLKVLGKGGMGAVFLAEDPKLGRRVALKVMLPRIAAADPTAKERFLREARAAARLKSDHIVTIYQVDETNGVPYLAMELLEGQSLDVILRAGQPLSAAQIICIARDIARGLADAHDKGLVHRDIKPGNLWLEGTLDAGVRVKILDFGLARAEQDDIHLTQSGAIVGTPAFMAPEQARGDKGVDARADLFSLGCVLYRLCTGEVPFKAETMIGTLMAVAMNDPVALTRRNESIPSELSQLITQLLEKDPSRRPKSARDVVARLNEIERSLRGSQAGDATFGLTTPGTSAPASSRVTTEREGYVGRGPLSPAFAGLLLAALCGLAAVIFFWQMPDGRVVRIECDDPSIKVAFEDGELKVTGAYKEPITLKPGKVDLRITRQGADGDDFNFETDKLIVNKGDKIVLKIEVLEGKVQIVQAGKGVLDSKALPVEPAPIAVADADRKAAEWVLSIGGKVQVNEKRWIHATVDLPKYNFALTQVNLVGNKSVTDAGLAHCKDLKRVTSFNLDSTNVTNDGLEQLKGLERLSVLNLWATKVSDEGLVHLQGLQGLKELGLGGRANVTDAGLLQLKSLKGLTHLYLDGTHVTNAGLLHLKDFKELTVLDLGATAVTDDGIAHLTEIVGLTSLSLHHTAVTDVTPEKLKHVKAMATLNLDDTKVTDKGLEQLQGLKALTLLYVRNTQVTSNGLDLIRAALPGCRILHTGGIIEPTDVDRQAAEWVLSLGGKVRLNGDKQDIAAAADLPTERFTVTTVILTGTKVTDSGLAQLKSLKGMSVLMLDWTEVTDAGLAHLSGSHELRVLHLDSLTKVTDAGLAHLKFLTGLTHLWLGGTSVTDAGLPHLKGLTDLSYLGLRGTRMTDAGMPHLKQHKELAELYLTATNVTDAGLRHLDGLTKLAKVDLKETDVTEAGVAELHAALPGCNIYYEGGVIAAKK